MSILPLAPLTPLAWPFMPLTITPRLSTADEAMVCKSEEGVEKVEERVEDFQKIDSGIKKYTRVAFSRSGS